jgi:hypothetical protein
MLFSVDYRLYLFPKNHHIVDFETHENKISLIIYLSLLDKLVRNGCNKSVYKWQIKKRCIGFIYILPK